MIDKLYKCVSLLLCITCVNIAAENYFDPEYGIQILQSKVEVYPPGESCVYESESNLPFLLDLWCIRYNIELENGLFITHATYYDDASYSESYTENQYEGLVNIVFPKEKNVLEKFEVIFQDRAPLMNASLWVNTAIETLFPKISAISIKTYEIPHWFYTEKKFGFVIELDDSTIWEMSDLETSQMALAQKGALLLPGKCLNKIGNSQESLLVNRSSVDKGFTRIDKENLLFVRQVQ